LRSDKPYLTTGKHIALHQFCFVVLTVWHSTVKGPEKMRGMAKKSPQKTG